MKKRNFALFISTICLSFSVFGAKTTVKVLKDRIANQASKINVMAAEIRDIDSKIASSNEDYLVKIKEIEKIEQKIEGLRRGLNDSARNISHEYKLAKKSLDLYLLEVSDIDNDHQVEGSFLYGELLNKKLTSLGEAKEESKNLLASINEYDQILLEKKQNEKSIYSLILDLEDKKKNLSQDYLTLKEKNDFSQTLLEKKLAKAKAKKKVYAKKNIVADKLISSLQLNLPLENYINATNGKKGITFKFQDTLPVKSPGTGKIVYAGELASYGKVIMVDHGNEVRSVLLGDMVVKVTKGSLVQAGDIIGYTVGDQAVQNTLYYEVRKKNIAQNTISWINPKSKKRI